MKKQLVKPNQHPLQLVNKTYYKREEIKNNNMSGPTLFFLFKGHANIQLGL